MEKVALPFIITILLLLGFYAEQLQAQIKFDNNYRPVIENIIDLNIDDHPDFAQIILMNYADFKITSEQDERDLHVYLGTTVESKPVVGNSLNRDSEEALGIDVDWTAVKLVDLIDIYPNPAKNVLYVKIPIWEKESVLNLYSVIGQPVLHQKTQQQDQFHLDVSNLPRGIYFLEIVVDNQHLTQKIQLF